MAGFRTRVRAVTRREHGFSLVETVVAIGTIFVSLTALAYTGTAGFRYIALARERQAASQIADQLMEQARALSFSDIQNGLNSSEVTTADPNIIDGAAQCGDPAGTYRFKSCSGESIIKSTFEAGTAIPPLVPHMGTIGRSEGYPIDYTWRTYVTNNDPSKNAYRVTVVVSWSGGTVRGAATSVQTQSLFAAPSGCVSGDTHPFPAPCQPFFFGSAEATQGRIDITIPEGGVGVANTSFRSGALILPGASSSVQQEQVAEVLGAFLQSGVELVDSPVPQTVGGSQTTLADSDPSSGALAYAKAPATGTFSGAGGALSTGSGTTVTFSNTAGDTGESDSAVAANSVTATCPPFGILENDGQPCGGSRVRQVGPLLASVTLADSPIPALGAAALAEVDAPPADTTAFVNRMTVTNSAGNLEQSVSRLIGRVVIGGVPASLPAPGGFDGFIVLSGYADGAQSAVGESASGSSAAIASSGVELRYWNGTGYTPVPDLTHAFTLPSTSSVTITQGSHTVVVQLSGSAAGAIVTPGEARVSPPLGGDFRYSITVDGFKYVDLLISVDLGDVSAIGSYRPAPTP